MRTAGGMEWFADPSGWRHVCPEPPKELSADAKTRYWWNVILSGDPKVYKKTVRAAGIDIDAIMAERQMSTWII